MFYRLLAFYFLLLFSFTILNHSIKFLIEEDISNLQVKEIIFLVRSKEFLTVEDIETKIQKKKDLKKTFRGSLLYGAHPSMPFCATNTWTLKIGILSVLVNERNVIEEIWFVPVRKE